ncbi:uncharacterized protein FFNC_15500 [Fusarium fujikuroi]|nr:uncharacterized protein FFE2_15899 [Fusarium fujikuroi]SCO25597.1 uncharacterized protein FFC1_15611 [Fusarium fujikuroi]SCO54414.1 uncharacterized protein FFNC_15500 [Fusarium fujikuroi]
MSNRADFAVACLSDDKPNSDSSAAVLVGKVPRIFLVLKWKSLTKDDFGFTPLSFAAGKGHKAVVELLLAYVQVSPDSQDKLGGSPLFWATVNGHESVIELFCKEADRAHELDLAALVEVAIEADDEFVEFLLSEAAVHALLLVTSQSDPSTLDVLLLKYPQWQYITSPLVEARKMSSNPR